MPIFRLGPRSALFIHIPKTGGSAIEAALARQCETSLYAPFQRRTFQVTPQHFTMRDIRYLFPKDAWDVVFAVVRHPVDRFVSEYRFQAGSAERQFGMAPAFRAWAQTNLEEAARTPHLHDNHLRPQAEFVSPEVETFRVEEGLGALAQRLTQLFGRPLALEERVNVAASREAVTVEDDLRAEIERFYDADYAAFGYPKGPKGRRPGASRARAGKRR